MNNYFIHTILRFLSKEKMNVAICISGFIISLITVFIITIYINHELSYDRQEGAENIYRIVVLHNKYSAGSENHTPLSKLKTPVRYAINESRTIIKPSKLQS